MVSTLSALNLFTALLLLLWPAWFSRYKLHLPLVNPYTITLAVTLPVELMKLIVGPLFLMDNGLTDAGYQYAVLVSNVYVTMQVFGLLFFLKICGAFRLDKHVPLQRIELGPRVLKRASQVFLLVFFTSFYLLASGEFGLVNWLANPREGYQFYRTGQGHLYALAISTLSASLLLGFLAKPKPGQVVQLSIAYLCLAYLLGSKMVLLSFFISTLIFLWFLKWKHLNKLLLFGAPVIFLLLVFNLYLALSDNFELRSIAEYFDYYLNASMYYTDYLRGDVQLYWGQISLSNLWAYVPRGIWPDKPVVYGVLTINELYYPGQAELTNTPAFGGAVEQFADFGMLGVVINGFLSTQSMLSAFVAYFVFKRPGVNFQRVTLAAALVMLVQYAPSFGLYFPGALYLGLVLVLAAVIRVLKTGQKLRQVQAQ